MERTIVEKKTRIGMVYSCNDWQVWCGHAKHCGLLIGIYGNKLYYFEKAEKINLKRFELVHFIEDIENPNVALSVFPLEQYLYESKVSKRFNKFSWGNKQAAELFLESKKYNNIKEITDLELKTEIVRLQKYIDDNDITSIIGTFTIRRWGRYQQRVGRDDHFYSSTETSVDSHDLYIKHLLKKGEYSDYYRTCSLGEENYDFIDEKSARYCIQEALSSYDKEEHLAFLLNIYIRERNEQLLKKNEIKLKLEGLFNYDMVGAALDNHRYIDDYEYEEVVEKYNDRSKKKN